MEKYSRLKIRKVLGVGQDMSGSISTSKIVQVLGPMSSEDKMPTGFGCWQITKAMVFIAIGSTLVISGFTHTLFDPWLKNDISNYKVLLSHSGGCLCGYGASTLLYWMNGSRQNMIVSCISSLIMHFTVSIAILAHFRNSVAWPLFATHLLIGIFDTLFILKALDCPNRDRTPSEEKTS